MPANRVPGSVIFSRSSIGFAFFEIGADRVHLAFVVILGTDGKGCIFHEIVATRIDHLDFGDHLGGVIQLRILLDSEVCTVWREADHFSRGCVTGLRIAEQYDR